MNKGWIGGFVDCMMFDEMRQRNTFLFRDSRYYFFKELDALILHRGEQYKSYKERKQIKFSVRATATFNCWRNLI